MKNANASTEASLPKEDDVTACTPRDRLRRGGPPSWDHRITVVASEPEPPSGEPPPTAVAPEPLPPTVVAPEPLPPTVVAPEPLPPTVVGPEPLPPTVVGPEPLPPTVVAPTLDEGPAGAVPDSDDTSVGDIPDVGRLRTAERREPARFDSGDDMTAPHASPLTTDSGQRILLLTQVKTDSRLEPRTPDVPHPTAEEQVFPDGEPFAEEDSASHWQSVVAPRGQHTQRIEAAKLVPDVAASRRHGGPAPSETGEDGQMPTRELDQILSDMAVLLRYGHAGQVRDRLEQLRRAYPEDLLLLRRIAEFHVETEQIEAALDALFALARGLFERRNVEGMRQALEQVRVLDADNARAARLLGLLEARADGTDDT